MTQVDLNNLIEISRKKEMSPREKEAQRRSFAYGNANISNGLITRECIDDAADIVRKMTAVVAKQKT